MGEVSSYPNGTFCWIDLGTPDVPGAKAFYGELFGWDSEDMPADEDGVYTLWRLGEHTVAAVHQHPDAEGAEWSSYICVDDLDAATARARELGATVMMEPFDIPGASRMSLIRDPAGAVVSLWQPEGHIGATLVNDPGTWSWNELVTPDVDAAKSFYAALFGWTAEDVPSPIPRTSFSLGHLLVGGMHAPAPGESAAPRWTVSFTVADANQTAARVEDLGGQVLLPPTDIPIGKFAIVSDPSGGVFTVAAFPGGAFRGVDGS